MLHVILMMGVKEKEFFSGVDFIPSYDFFYCLSSFEFFLEALFLKSAISQRKQNFPNLPLFNFAP
jgi:hypothetical protein